MTLVEFVIFGLSTWRVSSLLVDEAGPFRIFVKLREMAGIQHDADDIPSMIPDGFFAGIFTCVWCCSVWSGLFWTLISLLSFGWLLALPFALSSFAVFFQEKLNSSHDK